MPKTCSTGTTRTSAHRTDAAGDLLEAELADGPRPAKEMEAAAADAGISAKALRRARKRVGVKTQREGFGADGVWYWSLPDALGAQFKTGAPMAAEGHL